MNCLKKTNTGENFVRNTGWKQSKYDDNILLEVCFFIFSVISFWEENICCFAFFQSLSKILTIKSVNILKHGVSK